MKTTQSCASVRGFFFFYWIILPPGFFILYYTNPVIKGKVESQPFGILWDSQINVDFLCEPVDGM